MILETAFLKKSKVRSTLSAAIFGSLALAASTLFPASTALADACDDLAIHLKDQIDGITVGKTAANVIYLLHPAAKQIRLGCSSRSVTNELYAVSGSRNPQPAFLEFVASATAVIFTVPKDKALAGATRCVKRMGILHGDDVSARYRGLDMKCTRTKNDATIAISRKKER